MFVTWAKKIDWKALHKILWNGSSEDHLSVIEKNEEYVFYVFIK